jgi:exodeoxyribonuclease VII large subunit
VRGGGSITDLECFNDYALAREVALCTIPVITGIGHSTNRSICDEVAAVDCITPTDVAYYLLNKMEVFEDACSHLAEGIIAYTNSILADEESVLSEMIYSLTETARQLKQDADTDLQELGYKLRASITELTSAGKEWLSGVQMRVNHSVNTTNQHARYELDNYLQRIINGANQIVRINDTDLNNTENKVRLTDPAVILRRGYSYTLVNGKSLTNAHDVKAGDNLTTVISNGRIKSIAIDEKQ